MNLYKNPIERSPALRSVHSRAAGVGPSGLRKFKAKASRFSAERMSRLFALADLDELLADVLPLEESEEGVGSFFESLGDGLLVL